MFPCLVPCLVRRRPAPRPPAHLPRPNDDSTLKQPLTAHTKNARSLDSASSGKGARQESLDSAFAGPKLSIDQTWKGHLQAVALPAPGQGGKRLRKRKAASPTSPRLTTGQQARDVHPTLPAVAPEPLPLPTQMPMSYTSTPFDPNAEKFVFPPAAAPPPPIVLSANPRYPTPEFDPIAHRTHMHRFSQLLSQQQQRELEQWQLQQPGQRLSFVFDELTRRVVQAGFVPDLPDELAVEVGEELAVLECFDDGWSVVQRLPAALTTGAWEQEKEWEPEQGVIPTACWAGLPREAVVKPMRYSSLRHGVDEGCFEIGTAI